MISPLPKYNKGNAAHATIFAFVARAFVTIRDVLGQ